MEAINKNDMLEKILKIHHVPGPYRTLDETTVFTTFLSNFDFFKSKVFDNSLNEVLELASKHLKYSKIPAGQFLYHHGQPSNCIYLILKGEAWKFRQKTEREVELDAILKQKISAPKNVPKILETIALAKAQNARNKLPVSVQSNNRPSIPTPLDRSPKLADRDRSPQRYGIGKEGINDTKYDEVKKTGRDDVIIENRNEPESAKIRQGNKIASIAASRKIGEGLLKKLKDTKEVMNFENDYLLNLIKRSPELSAKYIFDRNLNLKFERKFGALETLGEMSMSLNQMRTSSVLAYTDLHVFYLDQKSYEKVFFAQIDEIREKLNFFSEYFKEINFNTLKKVCFLFTEKKFKLGEIIYKEGNPRDNLYFIKSGEVQLVKRLTVEDDPYTNYSNDSNELDLTLLTPYQHKIEKNVLVASVSMGHFFGEEAISDEPLRHFTAKSISNLTCYVVSPQVLARLPEKVLHNLQEMSTSKQNWRGNRLENIKNQPLFKNIQKRLALGPIYHDQKTKSSRAESSESSVEKSFSQEQRKTERFITPKRKMDLSSTEYGFFQTKKPHGLSYCQETSKNEESNAQYKITARKSSIEKQLLDRNCLTSRGGRKSRFVIEQENQKTLDSLKYSLHPTSSRNQRKITTKTFEIRSESDSEESIDRNNPSFGILQTEELSDLNGEGFEYNFVTKMTKRKTSPQSNKLRPILADKKGNDSTKLNEENQKSKEIRSISTPKTHLNSETTLKKLKGSLLNLMNKEKANFYAKNSRPEIESMGYFMIKTCNPSQTKGFDSLKLNDDSKCISPKTNSMSISKFESSLSPKNKKTSLVLKDKSQMLHIQGNKFKAIF